MSVFAVRELCGALANTLKITEHARDNHQAIGQFSWVSFLLTSVLFGVLHGRWLAGTLAGMGYALALYRRGQLGDAVVAHLTTNALIALLVLTQGQGSLWS